MLDYLRERNFIIYVAVLIMILMVNIYLNTSDKYALNSGFVFVKFKSSSQNYSIKELEYTMHVKNHSRGEMKFHAVIERPKAEWYPYLNSIPEKYYSELLILQPESSQIFELETHYQSSDTRMTGGSLSDFKVKFISPEEFEKQVTEKTYTFE